MGCGPSHPTIQGIPGFYPGVKQPGREAEHSLPPSAEVRNEWNYTPTTTTHLLQLHAFMGWQGIIFSHNLAHSKPGYRQLPRLILLRNMPKRMWCLWDLRLFASSLTGANRKIVPFFRDQCSHITWVDVHYNSSIDGQKQSVRQEQWGIGEVLHGASHCINQGTTFLRSCFTFVLWKNSII